MAATWSEIQADKEFRTLSFDEQEQVRNTYFNEVIAPDISTSDLDDARKYFDEQTKPTILSRAKDLAGDAIDYVKDAVKPDVPAAQPEAPDIVEQVERGERPTLPGYGIQPPAAGPERPEGSIHELRKQEQLLDLTRKRDYIARKNVEDSYPQNISNREKAIADAEERQTQRVAELDAEIKRVKALPTYAGDETFADVSLRRVVDKPSSLMPFVSSLDSAARDREIARSGCRDQRKQRDGRRSRVCESVY